MITRIVTAIALSFFCLEASASGLTPQLAVDLRVVVDAQLSPSGTDVAYRLERSRRPEELPGGRLGELWRVSADGGAAVQLPDSGFNPRMPRWSPDGSRLAWIARSDAETAPQLFIRSKEDRRWGDVTQLTRAPGGVSSFQWSSDGARIGYVSEDKEAEEQRASTASRDWIVFGEAPTRPRLYTIVIATREVSLITPDELAVWSFSWSPSGQEFSIGASFGTTVDDVCLGVKPYVVPAHGGTPRLVAQTEGLVSQVNWSGDGRSVTWLGSTDITDPGAGSFFSVTADGQAEPHNLTAGYSGTVRSAVRLPGRSNTVVLVAEESAQSAMHMLDLASGRMRSLRATAEIYSQAPTFSRDGKTFAVVANSPRHPDEVFIGRTSGAGGLRRLTYSNPELDDIRLGTQQVTRWRSKDGLLIEGVLIKPVGFVAGERYPVVIHVHGGSEMSSMNGWNGFSTNMGQLLAARGYVVLYPNYRGSSGRGTDFIRGNRRDLMGREWEDIESGLDHVIGLGIADGTRAGIYGHSWGGYAAGWGATWGSHRFKAAVAASGIYNWISAAGSADSRMHEQLAHWDAPLYQHFSHYLERSPIYEIRKAATPVLLLHGERDSSCPVTQAMEFHTALKWARVPVELVIYPREGHVLQERAHQLDFLERSVDWLVRYSASLAKVPEKKP